ncbi:MAG TPA: class I SAM-dependent methyltransferase [Candidatus Dormibacteraeota bacterium]
MSASGGPHYSGDAWASGPERVYAELARAVVALCPVSLAGARVLDLGAGTGAASQAVQALGAHPVAVDLEPAMLRRRRAQRPPAVAGDGAALPLAAGVFDAVIASFVLSHVPDPRHVLTECLRVLRGGGGLVAAGFAVDNEDPVKALVEDVLVRHGYRRPAWYEELKRTGEPRAGNPRTLEDIAAAAGFAQARARRVVVDVGVLEAEEILAWRLGLAHSAPFVDALDPITRARVRAEAAEALGPAPRPVRSALTVLDAVSDGVELNRQASA